MDRPIDAFAIPGQIGFLALWLREEDMISCRVLLAGAVLRSAVALCMEPKSMRPKSMFTSSYAALRSQPQFKLLVKDALPCLSGKPQTSQQP